MNKGELDNARMAKGYISRVRNKREFNGKLYIDFMVRQVKPNGSVYRVFDYPFGGNQSIIDKLEYIEPGSLVHVNFEIRSKERKNEPGSYYLSLTADDIFNYGDTTAPEYIWKVKDFMKRSEVAELRKQFPDAPDIEDLFETAPLIESIRNKKITDEGYDIKDRVNKKSDYDAPVVETKDDDLPF